MSRVDELIAPRPRTAVDSWVRVSVGDLVEIETAARAGHEQCERNMDAEIERQAAAIVALRDALVQAPHYDDCPWGDKVDGYGITSEDMTAAELAKCKCYLRVLTDSAPAARSAKAEIEQAAVERVLDATYDNPLSGHDFHIGWNARGKAIRALLTKPRHEGGE